MSRSLIQTVNAGPQTVAALGVIGLGTTVRRFGCNLRQSGDSIECIGAGYYTVTASITAAPTAEGIVSVEMYKNGAPVSGAISSATVAAGESAPLSIVATIRQGCACDGADALTFVLTNGAGTIQNISVRVEKA